VRRQAMAGEAGRRFDVRQAGRSARTSDVPRGRKRRRRCALPAHSMSLVASDKHRGAASAESEARKIVHLIHIPKRLLLCCAGNDKTATSPDRMEVLIVKDSWVMQKQLIEYSKRFRTLNWPALRKRLKTALNASLGFSRSWSRSISRCVSAADSTFCVTSAIINSADRHRVQHARF
jgi:hypothetical protein